VIRRPRPLGVNAAFSHAMPRQLAAPEVLARTHMIRPRSLPRQVLGQDAARRASDPHCNTGRLADQLSFLARPLVSGTSAASSARYFGPSSAVSSRRERKNKLEPPKLASMASVRIGSTGRCRFRISRPSCGLYCRCWRTDASGLWQS